MKRDASFWVGIVVIGVGIVCGLAALRSGTSYAVPGIGVLFTLIGISLAFQRNIISKIGWDKAVIEFDPGLVAPVLPQPVKSLPEDVLAQRAAYAEQNPPPAADAPAFNALTDLPDVAAFPGVDPMIPMYILDSNFRILDWNAAFSVAFDRSMEGRRGQSALEWVYLLDNFKDVLDHARRSFADTDKLPPFDTETLKYTSVRYGSFSALKRAYHVPDENGKYSGWLIILDARITDPVQLQKYQFDLIHTLSQMLLWTDYSLSYDGLLTRVGLYGELLRRILGEDGSLPPIPERARVLDLGAGTGNISQRLNNGKRLIIAVENNRTMLTALRSKCADALRRDDHGPGVIPLKQDINSLFGLPDDYFDVVVANNVLYSLADPVSCMREVHRVLKPGGEFRLSGPAKNFRLDKLFESFRRELISAGTFELVETHFNRARRINSVLEPELRRWSEMDLQAKLREAGFGGVEKEVPFYQGHGKIAFTHKS